MSKVERKEFQETKITRTMSPSRNFRSSQQNLTEFDNNLDHLLEDLQNSVSRPGSSLGHSQNTYRESSRSKSNTLDRSNSLNRITNIKSSNPVTEYSSDDAYTYTSPDGRKKVKEYKKEHYSYKTSGGGGHDTDIRSEKSRMQNSINQLDSLLDDLQQVKSSKSSSSYVAEKESYTGADPAFQSKKNVVRELHYGDTPRSRTMEREEAVTRDIEYTSREGTYGDLRPLRPTSPSSRTSTLNKQTKVTNINDYPMEVVETTMPDIDPQVLAHIDPNLRPPGNTKVTTTIKTYTYEIPGSGNYPTNLTENTSVDEKYVYSPNILETKQPPNKSIVYKNYQNKESTVIDNDHPTWKKKEYIKDTLLDQVEKYHSTPIAPSTSVLKETTTVRNYQPGYSPHVMPPSEKTYIYNEHTTTKNFNGYPDEPPRKDTYIIKQSHHTSDTTDRVEYPVVQPNRDVTIIKESNTTNRTINTSPPYRNGYPPQTDKTTIIERESHTTNNYGPGRPKSPSNVETFDPKYPPYVRPNEPVNIHYKYSTKNITENKYNAGYPPGDDTQVLLPKKFPTDSEIIDSAPPKRVDDLMATIGREPPNSPLNAGFNQHEQELVTQRKVDTLKRQQEEADEKKEPVVRTNNVSGPPVYYPPGHEMFAKKEEGGGAWRAEGGYGKGKGMYEYEASAKSKSKSKSGAAVVPVCLPLCCGLPCALL